MRGKESVKRLIVNADDFGLDDAANAGIIQAYESGIVRSASLMSCGAAFEEAAGLAKKHSGLGVGVHLSLNEGIPVAAKDGIVSLLSRGGENFLGLDEFLVNYFSFRIVLKQVHLEFESQIKKFLEAGLTPTHLDGHKHIHMVPGILCIVLKLAFRFKIPSIRLTKEPWSVVCPQPPKYWALSRLADLNWLFKVRKHSIKFPDHCYGLTQTCCLSQASLTRILKALPAGVNELICHPRLGDKNKEAELDALRSPEIKKLIKDSGIQLIRYDEIG
ncbi:MAG: ChbG/HpnK family deacetylase [Candidatus Omnitrophica bacterium]|nr:ChbG/HpnK family deacetylase [Candidatus Omnitrophota bacterium]